MSTLAAIESAIEKLAPPDQREGRDAWRAKAAGIAQPKNPVSTRGAFRLFVDSFTVLLSRGSFTAHRPASFARADASFRMTSLSMRLPCSVWKPLN